MDADKANSSDRITWEKDRHESGVEGFYGTGVENFGEYHGGYLNFGWWDEGHTDYLEAAEKLVHKMGTLLGLDKKSKLLDVACGMAPQDVYLRKNFGSTIDAVDVTWKHVEIARNRMEREQVTDAVRVHHGTATDLPFPESSFSHVMSIEGPEHFDTREAFFKQAFKVLVPGGVMALADYSLNRTPRTLWERFVVRAAQKLWHVPDANVYDNEVYRQKLETAGFINISIENVGKYTIPGYYFLNKKWETLRQLRKIRGWIAAYGGFFVDYFMYKSFKDGLVEYVLVRAEKPTK